MRLRRLILPCLLLIISFAFLFAQANKPQQPLPPASSPVEAHSLNLADMDRSVDPCVDFYTYSCSGWMKNNPIPPDQSSWSVYSKMTQHNREILREILEAAAVPQVWIRRDEKGPRSTDIRTPNDQKIGDYYASCMDEQAIEKAGITPLKPELDRIAAMKSKAELPEFLARFHQQDLGIYFGQSALFSFGADQDAKDSTQYIAETDQGGLGLPERDYYLKTDAKSQEIRSQYVAHVQKMFELLGDAPAAAAENAQTVMRIETALAKGSMDLVSRRNPNNVYHKMTREQLAALSPEFSWDRYFAAIGLAHVKSLNVANPDFVKAMNAALVAEPLSAWKTYLRWHVVHAWVRWLPAAFVNENFDFYEHKLAGTRELQPRWKRCVRYTDFALGEALGQAYVKKYFHEDTKERALKMVQQIEVAMERDIRQLPWMSDATKQQALAKLHTVVNKIGYPDKWRDYSAFKVVRGDALGNGVRGNEFEFRRQLNKIGKPLDRGEWYLSPPTVNAYYNPQMNDINFPAGVLQPPLFDPASDDAPNYGNTGATIGHELTHGFDDEGRQFDAQGNLRDWWTPQDSKEFDQRAACISDQYSQYTVVDDVKINGKLTLGEDVADLGGLILAYMAWQDQTRGLKLAPIDGLTPEQRFFIGYAQSWCSNQRPEALRMRAMIDPHSPPKYRTNGVVSNMPEFQKAFGCKAGSPMVRPNPCRVW